MRIDGISFRGKAALVAALVLAGAWAADRLLVRPAWERWSGLRRALAREEALLLTDRRRLDEAPRVAAAYRTHARSSPRGAGAAAATAVLKDIQSCARRSGASIRDASMLGGPPAGGQAAAILLEAPWDSFVRFIAAVESPDGDLEIVRMSVRRPDNGGKLLSGRFVIARASVENREGSPVPHEGRGAR